MNAKSFKKRVMLIDDDVAIQNIIRKVLVNVGIGLITAESLEEAFKLLENDLPHLFIIDINLKGENGFEFLQIKNGNPALKNIPSMIFTGEDDRRYIHMASTLGVKDYIVKPVNVSVLLQKVRKLLTSSKDMLEFKLPVREKVTVSLPVHITQMKEGRLILHASVLFRQKSILNIDSTLLRELEIEDLVYRTVPDRSGSMQDGKFYNCVAINGLDEPKRKNIRKVTRTWK